MNSPVGFAIVGTGMIANVHAEAIRQTPEARLKAVYSRDVERCRAFASEHGCRAAVSLDELVDDPDIRACSVTTPSSVHAHSAVPVLTAGKGVLCEKPLEVTPEAVA